MIILRSRPGRLSGSEIINLTPDQISFISEWQTLIAGLGAIVAAFIAGGFVLYQVRSSRRMALRERRSSFLGYKASLPRLLSRLIAWSDAIFAQIEQVHQQLDGEVLRGNIQFPDWEEVPDELIAEIRYLVRYTDDKRLIHQLFHLTQQIQVLEARLRSLNRDSASHFKHNIEVYLCNALEIFIRTESLFLFARGEAKRPPTRPDWERLPTKLLFKNVALGTDERFEGFVERRSKINIRRDAPWSERSWKWIRTTWASIRPRQDSESE